MMANNQGPPMNPLQQFADSSPLRTDEKHQKQASMDGLPMNLPIVPQYQNNPNHGGQRQNEEDNMGDEDEEESEESGNGGDQLNDQYIQPSESQRSEE